MKLFDDGASGTDLAAITDEPWRASPKMNSTNNNTVCISASNCLEMASSISLSDWTEELGGDVQVDALLGNGSRGIQ